MVLLLWGCSVLTPYRNTLATDPATPPAALGAPIDGAAIGGYLTARVLGGSDLNPKPGDPGLLVPTHALGGRFRLGNGWLEMGGVVDYAAQGWTRASAVGVLPAGSDPIVGVGTHVTVGSMPQNLGFGFTLDATYLSMPYARYTYVGDPDHIGQVVSGDHAGDYRLSEQGSVHPLRIRGTFAITGRAGPFDISPAMTVSPTFTNIGFAQGPTPIFETRGVLIPTLDVGFTQQNVRIGTQLWQAMGQAGATGGFDSGAAARVLLDLRL